VAALSIGRKGVHRPWVAATLKASREPAHLVAFIDLIAERAGPARILTAAARESA
jgi:hypothetical protein